MGLSSSERQRRYFERRMREVAELPMIECACGCGALIPPVTRRLEPARYAHGHNDGGVATRFAAGHSETPEAKAKRLAASKDAGYEHPPEARRRFAHKTRERHRAQRAAGVPYARGWNHTPEARAKMSVAKSGDKHPAWKGGVSLVPYGPGFTIALKWAVKDRDGHSCQRCGVLREKCPWPLAVHHVDGDKTNNEMWNLVTVCARCNGYFVHHMEESLAMFGALGFE